MRKVSVTLFAGDGMMHLIRTFDCKEDEIIKNHMGHLLGIAYRDDEGKVYQSVYFKEDIAYIVVTYVAESN